MRLTAPALPDSPRARAPLAAATRRLAGYDGPVRVDLTGVDFPDSTGVHFLVGWQRQSRERRSTFRISGVRPHPAWVLAVCGVQELLLGTGDATALDPTAGT
ncbi:STAS domain-containing protein [Streptodolium elevatio]